MAASTSYSSTWDRPIKIVLPAGMLTEISPLANVHLGYVWWWLQLNSKRWICFYTLFKKFTNWTDDIIIQNCLVNTVWINNPREQKKMGISFPNEKLT